MRVIDGDRDDHRAFDPKGVVVGLRWKPPNVAGVREAGPSAERFNRFVLQGEVVEDSDLGRVFMLGATPFFMPGKAKAL